MFRNVRIFRAFIGTNILLDLLKFICRAPIKMPFFPRLKSAFCQKKIEIVFRVIPHSFKDELTIFGKELLRGLAVALENSGMLPHPIHKLLFVQGLDILKLLHQPLGIVLATSPICVAF